MPVPPENFVTYPVFPFPDIFNSQSTRGRAPPATEQRNTNEPQAEADHEGPGYDGDDSDKEDLDPRVARSEKTRVSKSASQRLVHRMLRMFLQSKGLTPAPPPKKKNNKPTPPTALPELPTIPPMVDPATLERYVRQHHVGPTADNIQVAWSESMDHPWNQVVVNLLSSEFVRNVKACRYQLLLKLPDDAGKAYVKRAIKAKLASRQTWVRNNMQQMKDRSHLTPAELSAFFTEKKRDEAAKARRRERKKYLFLRRAEIIEDALNTPWAKNPEVWREIDAIFKLFDEKDMSSDETEIEARFGANKETRRIRKHWIDSRVSNLLHLVDSHYNSRLPGGMLKRGSAPLRRHLEARKTNLNCNPKPGLPINVYNSHLAVEAVKILKPKAPNEFLNIPQFAARPQDEMEY